MQQTSSLLQCFPSPFIIYQPQKVTCPEITADFFLGFAISSSFKGFHGHLVYFYRQKPFALATCHFLHILEIQLVSSCLLMVIFCLYMVKARLLIMVSIQIRSGGKVDACFFASLISVLLFCHSIFSSFSVNQFYFFASIVYVPDLKEMMQHLPLMKYHKSYEINPNTNYNFICYIFFENIILSYRSLHMLYKYYVDRLHLLYTIFYALKMMKNLSNFHKTIYIDDANPISIKYHVIVSLDPLSNTSSHFNAVVARTKPPASPIQSIIIKFKSKIIHCLFMVQVASLSGFHRS